MTIDEAITYHNKVANQQIKNGLRSQNDIYGFLQCAKEHKQHAEWLEELKAYKAVRTVQGYRDAIKAYTEECNSSVDKVVAELQDKSFERYGNQGMGGELVISLDDAVEIVKRGGADEK